MKPLRAEMPLVLGSMEEGFGVFQAAAKSAFIDEDEFSMSFRSRFGKAGGAVV
jgi:hypothetical protein